MHGTFSKIECIEALLVAFNLNSHNTVCIYIIMFSIDIILTYIYNGKTIY